jgi:hypothetical protein
VDAALAAAVQATLGPVGVDVARLVTLEPEIATLRELWQAGQKTAPERLKLKDRLDYLLGTRRWHRESDNLTSLCPAPADRDPQLFAVGVLDAAFGNGGPRQHEAPIYGVAAPGVALAYITAEEA